jgi:hypothetical protein
VVAELGERPVRQLGGRLLAAEEPTPLLVEEGPHEDLPHVGVEFFLVADAVPREVQLHERVLDEVLGAVPVTAQEERGPTHDARPGGEVRREPFVAFVHGAPSYRVHGEDTPCPRRKVAPPAVFEGCPQVARRQDLAYLRLSEVVHSRGQETPNELTTSLNETAKMPL